MAARLESFIEGVHRPDVGAGTRYLNRELSWLDFNARVLALADRDDTPLLERAKFLAIFSTNLDEFFQVRVAGLQDQAEAGVAPTSADGLTPAEQLQLIRERVIELSGHQERIFLEEVAPALADVGIQFSEWDTLDEDDRTYLVDLFERQILPVLTPLSVDPGHPFPYISSMSLNLGVFVLDPISGDRRFARVKVPDLLPRFVLLPDGERWLPLEQVIARHLQALFPGMEVQAHHAFRVTRNADLTVDDDAADDLLSAIEMELRRRRFGEAVRLEVEAAMDVEMIALLVKELGLAVDEVYRSSAPLALGGLWDLWALPRPDLKDEPFGSTTQLRLREVEGEPVDVFDRIRAGDILVHHPYDSFTTSVAAFIEQAAADPAVLAIKQTLYRASTDSRIVSALIRASERGKQVVALVELKARFDEQRNVGWARALEQVGVHVVYGLIGLKTHSKTTLVVRQEADGVRLYCHVGTGNYNEATARVYEDLGLLTCDPAIGADLVQFFNYLTGYGHQERYRKLLVAPGPLRPGLVRLIRREGELQGRIVVKVNNLVDPEMIDALYEASQAGASVDLIVRSICCLRPGVPGLSERIRVRSLVGRFLEHSRIFHFANGNGPGQPAYYIGSADLMQRNLDGRVEVLVSITSLELQERLQEVLDINLADDRLAWELLPDGSWRRCPEAGGVNAQRALRAAALRRRGTGP